MAGTYSEILENSEVFKRYFWISFHLEQNPIKAILKFCKTCWHQGWSTGSWLVTLSEVYNKSLHGMAEHSGVIKSRFLKVVKQFFFL